MSSLFHREQPLPPTGTCELTGTVRLITWSSWDRGDQAPGETGMVIAKLCDPPDGSAPGATVKGPCAEDGIQPGMAYRFVGRWVEHERFGRQFQFSTFVPSVPASRRGIIAYLTKLCPNVGERKADMLYDAFQARAVEVVRTAPEQVAAAHILTLDQAREAAAALAKNAALEATKLDLFGLFDRRGFPGKVIEACIGKWGAKAHQIIRRNPFGLLTAKPKLPGAGFKRCDKLYCDLGRRQDALKRQMLSAWHMLREDGNGHTWISHPCVRESIRKAIREGKADAERAIHLGVRAHWLATLTAADGQVWVAEYRSAKNERTIADQVRVLRGASALWASASTEIVGGEGGLSAHQLATLGEALREPVALLTGTPGTGKAQPLDAKVLTPTGWKLMGDIVPGDEVIAPSGGRSRVVSIHPQGEIDIYRVTFSDGSSTECSLDHLWLTQTRHSRKNAQRKKRPLFRAAHVRTTEEIMQTLRAEDGHRNHFIPMVEPIEFSESYLPLDPYLVGLLLGDGCFRSGSITFSKPDEELADSIRNVIPSDCVLKLAKGSGKDYRIVGRKAGYTNEVLNCVRLLGLYGKKSTEKFVPDIYKFSSVATRTAILQGLLDTDASVCHGYDLEYSSSSKRLAEDVQFLAESLGGKARITSRIPVYTHAGEQRDGQKSYRIHISLPASITPFRLTRKQNAYSPRSKYPPTRVVDSIEFIGRKQAQCICVDHPDRLYVTDHCIVTHNTYTAAQVVKWLACRVGLQQIAVCAPTGKAAVRISAAMKAYALDVTATTVHRLLDIGRNGHDGDGWGFTRNARCPLEQKVVIVDESSMLDTDLAAALFDACAPGTHVLLIGDPYQLPPVGHGAPLRDLIAAGVPNGRLTEIRRNAGLIVHACARIKDGQDFETSNKFDPAAGLNLKHVEANTPEEAAEFLQAVLGRFQQSKLFGDPIEGVQVLVALNGKSKVSRTFLNRILQTQLNPSGATAPHNPFRVGDKIICTKNNGYPAVEYELGAGGGDNVDAYRQLVGASAEVYVANGDQGRVLAVGPRVLVARFTVPDRTVKIHLGKVKDAEGDADAAGGDGADGDDQKQEQRTGTGCDFALAYAITCHKSQGSEWPCVIVMVDDSPGARRLCSREHVYTAISRARQLCITIGKRATMLQQCRKVSLDKRKTFLQQLITGGM